MTWRWTHWVARLEPCSVICTSDCVLKCMRKNDVWSVSVYTRRWQWIAIEGKRGAGGREEGGERFSPFLLIRVFLESPDSGVLVEEDLKVTRKGGTIAKQSRKHKTQHKAQNSKAQRKAQSTAQSKTPSKKHKPKSTNQKAQKQCTEAK